MLTAGATRRRESAFEDAFERLKLPAHVAAHSARERSM
jgi:hypothetical protein